MGRAIMRDIERQNRMIKLLNKFKAEPTQKNAQRLLKHLAKHPMSECFIDADTHNQAKQVAL